MRCKEINAAEFFARASTESQHELDGLTDFVNRFVILASLLRFGTKTEVPILRVVQVRKATVDESSNKVQRQPCAFVTAQ